MGNVFRVIGHAKLTEKNYISLKEVEIIHPDGHNINLLFLCFWVEKHRVSVISISEMWKMCA